MELDAKVVLNNYAQPIGVYWYIGNGYITRRFIENESRMVGTANDARDFILKHGEFGENW